MKRIRAAIAYLLLFALLCPGPLAAAESYIVEDDGSKWYADRVEFPDGTVVKLVDHDRGQTQEESTSGSGATTVENPDGSVTIITGDTDAVQQNPDGSVTVESGQIRIEDPAEEAEPLTGAAWQARLDAAARRNGYVTDTWWRQADGNVVPVDVVYVGLGRSMIKVNGEERLVDTCELLWETEAPADQLLAVVNAPKNGQAAIRSKTSTKATCLEKCRTNQVVRVLKVGPNWTFVDHAGLRGYIQTGSLSFRDNTRKTYTTGYITVKGKTPSGETVYIRSAPKKNARHLQEYPVGSPLTIFSQEGDWTEVDIGGWHCYILSKFVTLDGPELTAAAY